MEEEEAKRKLEDLDDFLGGAVDQVARNTNKQATMRKEIEPMKTTMRGNQFNNMMPPP